jgi:two-component system chemotaxis response regulator CheB
MTRRLVAVGCSWGGLAALSALLGRLPAELDAALVVAQHRAEETSSLEELLRLRSRLPVREAEDKDELEPGRVYLAPAGYHVLVQQGHLALSTDEPVEYSRPSLDVLFETAADAYGSRCVGVVLTGANADGAEGLARVRAAGGTAIVQDPATAERAEMPAAALEAAPDARVLSLEELPAALVELCGTRDER